MKKAICLLTIFALCFVLSGCIDIFQHITKDNNGVDKLTVKITVSKAIFEMVSGLSGNDDFDFENLLNESDMTGGIDVNDYDQYGASVTKVNDSVDVGFLIDMNIDYSDKNTEKIINRSNHSFIPNYNGKDIIMHIDRLGGDSGSADSNVMTALFLAAGKYRLAINKKCIADIDKVIVKATKDGESIDIDINFMDLHDEYLIEIPIPILVMSDVDIIIYSK